MGISSYLDQQYFNSASEPADGSQNASPPLTCHVTSNFKQHSTMGMFLSLTSIAGKTQDEVVTSLTNYAKSVGGGLEKENLSTDNDNCCVIKDASGNTTIFNPYAYLEWDKSSEFISRELNAPVFSFHIHDGDLWMYLLFRNGKTVDQFNPIPEYWDDNLSEEEI